MYVKNNSPCDINCPNRSVGCHGKCEKYLAYWNEQREKNKVRYEATEKGYDLFAMSVKRDTRIKRKIK